MFWGKIGLVIVFKWRIIGNAVLHTCSCTVGIEGWSGTWLWRLKLCWDRYSDLLARLMQILLYTFTMAFIIISMIIHHQALYEWQMLYNIYRTVLSS